MLNAKERKGVLSRLVAQLEAVAPYADALYSEYQTRMLATDKTGAETRVDADAGVKIRAFDGQQYHDICIQGWQPDVLQQEVHALAARLKARQVTGKQLSLKIDKEIR